MERWIDMTAEDLEREHICCAIADKKHEKGVAAKKSWLKDRLEEGHVFRKLDVRGKVFIEYAPLETAWTPIEGENYLYVYCLWVAGSYKGKGYGKALLESCIQDAKQKGKSGVCVIGSSKKKPYLSDKKFFVKFGFRSVDTACGDYELLALSLDGTMPRFTESAKRGAIDGGELTVYYGMQCPFILDSVAQIGQYCASNDIPLRLCSVDTLEKAKAMPCVFNNWAVFLQGKLATTQLLNAGGLQKLLSD